MALSDLFSRRRKDDADPDAVAADAPVHPTRALPKFLSTLSSGSQPLLLELGPLVGANVNFFGEQLGCKIFVENLYKDVDRLVREGQGVPELTAFFERRFPQADASVDGILCWDVFDYLEKPVAQVLAHQLTRLLRPEGALLAVFHASAEPPASPALYTRYLVIDRNSLQYRPYEAARGRQRPLPNRDIQRMFEPLRITEQFLLKNNLREVLFRKAAASAESALTPPSEPSQPIPTADPAQ